MYDKKCIRIPTCFHSVFICITMLTTMSSYYIIRQTCMREYNLACMKMHTCIDNCIHVCVHIISTHTLTPPNAGVD